MPILSSRNLGSFVTKWLIFFFFSVIAKNKITNLVHVIKKIVGREKVQAVIGKLIFLVNCHTNVFKL